MGDSAEKTAKTVDSAEKTAKKVNPVIAFIKKVLLAIKTFFVDTQAEFKKISWPDKKSTYKQAVAVVAISVVVGVIIAVLDWIVQYGVSFLTSI